MRVVCLLLSLSVMLPIRPAAAQPDPGEIPPPAPTETPEPPPAPAEVPPGPAPEPEPTPEPEPKPAPDTEDPPPRRPAARHTQATPEPTRFGLRGQTVIDTGLFFSAERSTFQFGGSEVSQSGVSVAPAFGHFIADDVMFRLRFLLQHAVSDEDKETSIGAGVGFAVNIVDSVRTSVLPGVGLMLVDTNTSGDLSFTRLLLTLSIHYLVHPIPHMYLGGGASLSRSLMTRVNDVEGLSVSTVGLDGVVGVRW